MAKTRSGTTSIFYAAALLCTKDYSRFSSQGALIGSGPRTGSHMNTPCSLVTGEESELRPSRSDSTNQLVLQAASPNAANSEVEDKPESNVIKSRGTWNPIRLAVLKLGMTELKFTSPLNYEKRDGFYNCANCGFRLFDSSGKYDSRSGWPSFWKTFGNNRVALKQEWDGRVECSCGNCGGHLGHVFPDGPRRVDVKADELQNIPESDPEFSGDGNKDGSRLPRFCMNGASLKFKERK